MVDEKTIYGEEQEQEMKLAAEQGRQPICVYCGHSLNKVRQYQDTVIIWTYNQEKKEYEKDDSGGSADKASHECDQCNCEVKDWDFVDENLISF